MENFADIQQVLATSSSPGEEFQALSWSRQREVFFQLPESVQQSVMDDLTHRQLYDFVRRLDPDEATDVLIFTDQESQELILRQLDDNRREKLNSSSNLIQRVLQGSCISTTLLFGASRASKK